MNLEKTFLMGDKKKKETPAKQEHMLQELDSKLEVFMNSSKDTQNTGLTDEASNGNLEESVDIRSSEVKKFAIN